ncbi:hypothetical protein EV1_021224 [Malus domestica]
MTECGELQVREMSVHVKASEENHLNGKENYRGAHGGQRKRKSKRGNKSKSKAEKKRGNKSKSKAEKKRESKIKE